MGEPEITVAMPVHNSARFLERTLESLLGQTFTDFELVAVDDCSTDASAEILRGFADRDARIRLLGNDKNLGAALTRSRAVAEGRGKYTALFDSDDVWLPDKLASQLSLIKSSGADIVYCSYSMIDERGEKIHPDFIVPETTDLEHMLVRSVMSCSTVLAESGLLKRYPFDPAYAHEDYVLWLTLLKEGYRAVGDPRVLSEYRVVRGSRSSDKLKSAVGRWRVYRDYLGLPLAKSLRYFAGYALAGVKKYG